MPLSSDVESHPYLTLRSRRSWVSDSLKNEVNLSGGVEVTLKSQLMISEYNRLIYSWIIYIDIDLSRF